MLWQAKTISEPHFYISAYFEENKDRYIDTMRQVSVTGDWNDWCLFFLEAVERQVINNLTIAENIRTLYEDKKKIFVEILSSKWAVTALDYVFTNPVFRNNTFTSQSGIPPATAARCTKAMIENDVLLTLEEAAGRKPALYSFEPEFHPKSTCFHILGTVRAFCCIYQLFRGSFFMVE